MATTVNTLETDTEVFKGDRVVVDGVERELGNVTPTTTDLVSSTDPFGDGSLVAKYELDGDALDTTGTYNGTATGVTYGTGKYGQAAMFTAGRIVFSGANPISGSMNRTVSLWAKLSNGQENEYLFAFGENSSMKRWDIGYIGGKVMIIHYGNNTTTAFTLDDGQWHHIVAILDGTTTADEKIFIDGVEKTTTYSTATINTGTAYWNILGNTNNLGTGTIAGIDQVEIYNRALTATEVNTLYTQTATKYTADFNTPLASIPTSVYRLDHDNLTIDGTPTATTATVLDSRTGLIASGDTVLLDGVGVVCNPVVDNVSFISRASTATYVDAGVLKYASIDDPRFEKDGLLIEGASTNLLTYSNDFSNNVWANYTAISANAIEAPDGTATADTIDFTSIATVFQEKAVSQDTKYTVSLFVKQIGTDNARLQCFSHGGTTNKDGYVEYNFNTDTLTATGSYPLANIKREILNNGWVRISGTQTITDDTTVRFSIETISGNGSIAVWGAQIEKLPFASSYIPTTTTAVTRSADIVECQYDLTYPTQTAPTRIALANNDIVPTVASDTFDGIDTFTKTYNTVTKTARDVEYGFVADEEVEIVQLNLNQNMEP